MRKINIGKINILTSATDPNFALLHFIPELYKFYIGDKLYTGKIKQ